MLQLTRNSSRFAACKRPRCSIFRLLLPNDSVRRRRLLSGLQGSDTRLSPTDRQGLFVARIFYFVFFAAIGVLAPYFNVYLESLGLSGVQIGWLASIPPIVALLANPFWGAIADRFQLQTAVLAGCALVTGLTALLFIPADSFWPLMVLVIMLYFFRAPIPAIADSAVMTIVSRTGRQLWAAAALGQCRFCDHQLRPGHAALAQRFEHDLSDLRSGRGRRSLRPELQNAHRALSGTGEPDRRRAHAGAAAKLYRISVGHGPGRYRLGRLLQLSGAAHSRTGRQPGPGRDGLRRQRDGRNSDHVPGRALVSSLRQCHADHRWPFHLHASAG